MASQLMFEIDTSPKLARVPLTRSLSSNIIPDYPLPSSAGDSRSAWSVPTSPVATIKRQHVEPDIWSTSPTKRPTCVSMASFAQSMTPVLSPFTVQRDTQSFGEAVLGFKAASNDELSSAHNGKDAAGVNSYRSFSPYSTPSDTFSPASPSIYSSSSMFPDLAISPPDLATFPFCHFEQMLSPSLISRDPEFPTDEASGSVVSGCLLSGCHGHDPTHDQDGHPSPAVWSPSTLASMRKRWRHMRKQPPAQTAVPPRPCLKKMSALATESFSSSQGRTTPSSCFESPHLAQENGAFGDNLETLRFHLDFSEMVPGEWTNGGNRSRSTSGASSTMLFSPFPSDHEDGGLGSRTPEMAMHVLQDEGLSEVEEYMLQGFLRAFSQPHHVHLQETVKSTAGETSVDDSAEESGTTPTPASILAQQRIGEDDTIRGQSPRRRPTVCMTIEAPATVPVATPKSAGKAEPGASGSYPVSLQDAASPRAEPTTHAISSKSPLLDADAEIDGEWQWACPITVPLPVRAGLATAMVPVTTDDAPSKDGQRQVLPPSRSDSVLSTVTSKACEKRRVHFPVCPGGNGEMALCALYPTYSATAYDRTPLEPPTEEERSFRMPDRFSRDLTDEDEFGRDIQDYASERSLQDRTNQSADVFTEEASGDDSEWGATALSVDFDASAAALDWSCSNDFMSAVPSHDFETSMTDDNWEDWLDQRKSACQIASSSTDASKVDLDESSNTEDLSTPVNTPLDRSPLESPANEIHSTEAACDSPIVQAVSPTYSLQSLLEREPISSDTLSHTTASDAGPGAFASNETSCQKTTHEVAIANDGIGHDESWLPHSSERKEPEELCQEESSIKRASSIPKLKKKKKSATAEKRTTIWTKTQPTWDQFASDSWSTGEEGCLGGF